MLMTASITSYSIRSPAALQSFPKKLPIKMRSLPQHKNVTDEAAHPDFTSGPEEGVVFAFSPFEGPGVDHVYFIPGGKFA